MKKIPVILFLVCLTAFSVWAKEYRLTDNGKIVGILSIGDISRNPNTNQETYVITFDNICKGGNKNNS